MNTEIVGDPNAPYAGKRGRHPRECNCPTCASKRGGGSPPNAKPSHPTEMLSATTSPTAPQDNLMSGIDTLLREGEEKDNISVIPQSKSQPTEKGEKPAGPKTPARVSPRLLKFVGLKLSNITKIEGYKLSDDEADEIAGAFSETADAHGWKISSDFNLGLLMFIWLGIPTIEWVVKYISEKKDKAEKEEKQKLAPKTVTEIQPIPEPAQKLEMAKKTPPKKKQKPEFKPLKTGET